MQTNVTISDLVGVISPLSIAADNRPRPWCIYAGSVSYVHCGVVMPNARHPRLD